MSEIEKLEQQLEELKAELTKQKQTNELLKKRAIQAIIGNSDAAQCEADRKACEVGRAQAEQANRVKSIFLETVSHEIRSSMHGIIGMTELVLGTQLSEEQRLYLEMVNTSVDRLMVVVNEVLDLSSIETGELELELEDFNLKESLDHDLYVLNLSAEKKGLKLNCTIDSSVPSHVHGDAARLVQIITSLVNNSIKFTDEGGVFIRIANNGYDQGKNLQLRFQISDTGRGIDPENLAQIQHYFNQELQPDSPSPLSVGLPGVGLTVTSQLVKIMKGELGVVSEENGTTFWFTLPYKEVADFVTIEKKANETLENIKEEATYALRGAKILLAEDEYINRILIETVLKQLGVDVISVDNGEEAIRLACGGDFQLILMDIQMEGVDGLEATRTIRKFEKKNGGHVPIVALTALAMGGDREKCLQAGMDDYLAKPVERKDMVAVLSPFLTSKALVVDSDPVSQNIFVRTLIEAGWQVTIAETKRAAMYEASLAHFDLVIFDIINPHMEGLAAIKIIRQLEEYSGQKAIIIGLGDENMKEDMGISNIDHSLQRPVTKEKIEQKLSSL